jgi:hypothetical protein
MFNDECQHRIKEAKEEFCVRINLNRKSVLAISGWTAVGALLTFGVDKLIKEINRYDSSGFDKDGYDRDGYSRNGYDIKGFDKSGYDTNGFNREGRDREGFDIYGYDNLGYGRDRYNCHGIDRAGNCRQFYASYINQLRNRYRDAYRQMEIGEHRYALHDARIILEETLKLNLQHNGGDAALGNKLLDNLKICEREKIFNAEFIDRLHDVRKICNFSGHKLSASEQLSRNKVYFVLKQVRDLLNETENSLVYN